MKARLTIACILLAVLGLLGATVAWASEPAAFITVSGTVTGPSGPLSNCPIWVGTDQDWRETVTAGDGMYSVSLHTGGHVHIVVRPPTHLRLAQAIYFAGDVTTDVSKDFTLVPGNLLRVRLTGHGTPLTEMTAAPELQPLININTQEAGYVLDWDESAKDHYGVLPPDVYHVTFRDLPDGYYPTSQPFDVRAGDVTVDMALNTQYVHPLPYDPPDASKISIGPVDNTGHSTVIGSAGAVPPFSRLLLVNLRSTNQALAISESDGSFSSRIFAAPGSAIMIKHGPPDHRWTWAENAVSEGFNPLPGTIVHVPPQHDVSEVQVPYVAVGKVPIEGRDVWEWVWRVGGAWAFEGGIGPAMGGARWERQMDGMYEGRSMPGLYLGGLNWTHPALGDLDGDGDLDLLVGEESGRLVLFSNDGTTNAPDWKYATDSFAGFTTDHWAYPALGDVTGDGALDLVVVSGSGVVSIYQNDGTPSLAAWPSQPDTTLWVDQGAAPLLEDLNGDGDLDLLVGTGYGEVMRIENTGTAGSPQWDVATDPYAGVHEGESVQLGAVDLDGDGDRDLLVGLCGRLVWYRRGGTTQNPTWTRVDADPIGYGGGSCASSPAAGDWDGDGDQDVITGEHWGTLRLFQNDGPPSWLDIGSANTPFELAGDTAPALGDWDGDGDQDLLLGQTWGEVHQYTNMGNATQPDWHYEGVLLTIPWTNHPHPYPALADIDGDSDLDLFIGEGGWQGEGAGGNIHFYRNDGTSAVPNWMYVTDSYLGLDVGGWSTPAFTDIDSDGDLDLFVGDEGGTLTFVRNDGTPSGPIWAPPVHPYAGLGFSERSAPTFFDVDQDGDLDLLVGTGDGSLASVSNTGTALAPQWDEPPSTNRDIHVGSSSVPTTADLNGDGQPELLLGDGDGGLNLYEYLGPALPPGSLTEYAPGDPFEFNGTLRIYSPAIGASAELGETWVDAGLALTMLSTADGRPLAHDDHFMSPWFTPSGFPIEGFGGPNQWHLPVPMQVGAFHHVGGNAIEAQMSASGTIPDQMPAGTYQFELNIARFEGVPTDTTWVGAYGMTYTDGGQSSPITISPASASAAPDASGAIDQPERLVWRLLADDYAQGTRGVGAREDQGVFELTTEIVTQSPLFYVPPIDERTGQPISYRLEPHLPRISYCDRRMPSQPLLAFDLPGGELSVSIRQPDGTVRDLGSAPFAQSFNRTASTRWGSDLNNGTVQLNDIYSLTTGLDRFRVTFDQYGHHIVTMTGGLRDLWGNLYAGGGTYDLWVAHPLDIDPGVLPGTPLAINDSFNPTIQVMPRVPADVQLTITHYPQSDPALMMVYDLSGKANRFGTYSPGGSGHSVSLSVPGEYRVDLLASYADGDGKMYMGTMTWGGVVMTPDSQAHLIAHGRRGLDSLDYIPNHWFVAGRDIVYPPGVISHAYNPYYRGDVLWSALADEEHGGNSLIMEATMQDLVGDIEPVIRSRAERMHIEAQGPGTLEERFAAGEMPTFSSTRSGMAVRYDLENLDQIAYGYQYSQRPGVRVREEIRQGSGGYWRLNTTYDDQLGVGLDGDLVNDFKFQYVGVVYRDLDAGYNEYLGQGSGWVRIPDDDPLLNRVMPPFAGPGNGGWTTEGGPLLTLKGEDIHIFILPTGVRPGQVLEVGDAFRFAGHMMPTLPSAAEVTVTAPSGTQRLVACQGNRVGYCYDPAYDFVLDEPGLWSVDVNVWHDGQCSGGSTVSPYPHGDVLGSDNGRYWFYVVEPWSPRLRLLSPQPGTLEFGWQVTPITISGPMPAPDDNPTIDYTISMPGFILEHGRITLDPMAESFAFEFDPDALHQDFPNLDLTRRDDWQPGLSDTFTIGLLMEGERDGQPYYRANTITIQDEQVFVGNAPQDWPYDVFLPVNMRS